MKKFIFLLLVFQLFTINQAQAYIEPGIISMFLQAIIAAVVGCIAYMTFYWQKFRNFLKKIFIKSNNKNKS